MKAQTASITSVLSVIMRMTNNEDIDRAATLRDEALSTANPAQQQQIIQAWKNRNQQLLSTFRQQGEEQLILLRQHGYVAK